MRRPGGPAGALTPRAPTAPLLASAVLLGLAYPPFHLALPSFVALVPLAVWVGRLPAGAEGRRDALRGGCVVGLAAFGLQLHWLLTGLLVHTVLAVPAFLVAVLVPAALAAAATAGMHRAVTRLRWPVWLAVPVFWTAMEWVRAHLGDLSFPWMQLGDSLTGWPRLIGAADLVGSRGLSLWLALVSGLLAEAVLRWRPAPLERWLPSGGASPARGRAAAWRPAAAALLAAAVPIAYSLHRWSELEPVPAAEVVVLQTDVPPDLHRPRSGVGALARAQVAGLLDAEDTSRSPAPDLVVLPETVVPGPLDPSAGPDGAPPAWIDRLARSLDAPVLFGASGLRAGPDGPTDRFNEAFLRGPDARWLGRYAKRRLVPGAETVPFTDAPALRGPGPGGTLGGFAAGPDPELLPVGGARFGVLVCYEAVFAELSRGHRRRGADFLVNVTNDAWFGRESPARARSAGFRQHPAHLVMRAVENRVGVVRSANRGISGLVDPFGRRSHRTRPFGPAAVAGTVWTTPDPPPFVRWGDVAGAGAALAAAAAVIAAAFRRPRPRPSAG